MTIELENVEATTPGSFDLDELLSESLELSQKNRQMRSSKKAGNKGMPQVKDQAGWLNKSEMEQFAGQVAKIKEASVEWKTCAAVLLIHAQVCTTCHSEHKRVEGIFIKRENTRLRAINYVIPKATLEWASLPRTVEVRPSYTHICPDCYSSQGWESASIIIKE